MTAEHTITRNLDLLSRGTLFGGALGTAVTATLATARSAAAAQGSAA